jgi:predicted ABC-type ATPase
MAKKKRRQPLCIVIAEPNGAGKTTFARDFLTDAAGVVHFINADLTLADCHPSTRNSPQSRPGDWC